MFRKEWRLENVPQGSPLDGALTFQLNCHSESQVSQEPFLPNVQEVLSILNSYSLYENGQDFLVMQYIFRCIIKAG